MAYHLGEVYRDTCREIPMQGKNRTNCAELQIGLSVILVRKFGEGA